jgi:hypothetical protein
MVCPGEKESSANMLIKRIARIQKILGNQVNNLIDVFIYSPLFWRTRAGKNLQQLHLFFSCLA